MSRLTYNEMAAEVCEHVIAHAAHGYSQPNRMGDGTVETLTLSDGSKVKIHGGDYDCSELMRMCYAAVGVLPSDSYMWTGNEDSLLTSHGFIRVSINSAQKGDVLLKDGHTEMYLGNNMQGGARIAETGGINGAKGDQTGWEITKSAFNPYQWTACYRSTKKRPDDRKLYFGYSVHVQGSGWTSFAYDGDGAGTTGQGKRLEGIRFDVPSGVILKVTEHLQGVGDIVYSNIKSGMKRFTTGSEGDGRRMEAIKIDVLSNTNPDLKNKKLYYRIHQQTYGWSDWISAGTWAGVKGQSKRLEAFQAKFK